MEGGDTFIFDFSGLAIKNQTKLHVSQKQQWISHRCP